MADRGWNPKACVVGVSETSNEIFKRLGQKWKELIDFYFVYKKNNLDDFYNDSNLPVLDFILLDSQCMNRKKIDASKYHFVFLLNNGKQNSNLDFNEILLNENSISIKIIPDNLKETKYPNINDTFAILNYEEYPVKSVEFILDVLRFCIFPRYVSFDFSDFNIIKKRIVNIKYFRTSDFDYENQFNEFYHKNLSAENIEKGGIVIFFFHDCGDIISYFNSVDQLKIPMYSDHCSTPTTDKVKVLLIF